MAWLRWVLAGACLGVAGYLAATRWSTILAGHPAYLIMVVGVALAGLILGAAAARARGSVLRRGGRWRAIRRATGAGSLVIVLAATLWLAPFPAEPRALAVVQGALPGVTVTAGPTSLTLTPSTLRAPTGLIFQPGARVDPRAYAGVLAQVAAAGYLVVIVKAPLDFALLDIGAPSALIGAHPEITAWALGGHSLGGVAASAYAKSAPATVRGLVLWASYPADSLRATTLQVTSVIAGSDGLASPSEIRDRAGDLPADTDFVVIDGGVHAYFGDYGPQPGDGRPSTPREVAQQQIVAATIGLLARLSP